MNGYLSSEAFRRVLGRVPRHDFVGRAGELDRVMAQASFEKSGRGLLLLMEPSAGVSELLRQAYDELFNQRSEVIPIYYAFTRSETTAVSAAIEFLNAFLQQYIAFRRNEPALCHAALTLQDLLELAPPPDLEWVEQLVEAYKRQRFSNDDKALVRFCLGAPQRVPPGSGRPFVMLDGAQLAEQLNGTVVLGTEVLRVFGQASISYVLAGLRRQILQAAYNAKLNFETIDLLRLEQLSVAEARLLSEHVARRQQVATSEEARDLLVQQFGRSPFFITIFLQAAREGNLALASYLDCERLYVDELLGGRIHRHFTDLLEEIAPSAETRLSLIRLLWEAHAGDQRTASFEACRRRLHVTGEVLEEILQQLHIQEFVNWDGTSIEFGGGPQVWKDYLKSRYRLNILNEPRALVVADMLADALKYAPHTMARHYKQSGRHELRELLSSFDCQRVPAVLLNNSRFNQRFKGASEEETHAALVSETDLIPLPQVVNVASCLSFSQEMRQVCDEHRCMVARAFEDGVYSDAREVVILAAEVESKLEVETDVAELWCERLEAVSRSAGFRRHQLWLISNEGFSDEAVKVLESRRAYSSSRRQLELLFERFGAQISSVAAPPEAEDEFLIVVPMGQDNELVAANTVEQIARRLNFRPDALNQIRTAIVEACINASEHSFSPDRKIYQRFRVENDRLVVTISSRGIVPSHAGTNNNNYDTADTVEERRGWGLKLIRSLMDEVEFEHVDEGTRLRMTKYVRNSSS
ncbi:MAG TPA: ATP-binding protein [Pyrinomonadaceae bacterium]